MTSPVDAVLKGLEKGLENAVQKPVSLGWIAAHALSAGGISAAAWRDPLALARSAAAGMAGIAGTSGLSIESRDDGIGAAEFVKPFRAASEAVGLIREPLKPGSRSPQGGAGTLAGTGLSAMSAFAALSVLSGPGTGAVADMGPADSGNSLSDAIPDQTLSDLGGEAKAGLGGLGSLGAVGAFAALASNGIGGPFRSSSARSPMGLNASAAPSRRGPDGTWVETGNPTTRNGISASPRERSPQSAGTSRSASGPQSVPGAKRKPSVDPKSAVTGSGASGSPRAAFAAATTPSFPPAQTDFEVRAERVTRKLARYAAGSGPVAGQGSASGSGKPASRKRAPFIFSEDPETIARFKKLIEAQMQPSTVSPVTFGGGMEGGAKEPAANTREATPGIGPRAGESGSDGVTPVAPPFSGHAGSAGHPGPGNPAASGLSDLANELYAPARPAADSSDGNAYIPIQSSSSTRNPQPGFGGGSPSKAHRIAPRSVAAPGTASSGEPTAPANEPMPPGNGLGSGNGASVQRHGQSQVEWMDEEDDLAVKLHRLLRRQAKRRGVELP